MLELLLNLKENDGFTVKKGKVVSYKTGWQVATRGEVFDNPIDAYNAMAKMNGSCGVWLSEGLYYVDECQRVNTKKKALEIGRLNNQISIFGWTKGNIVYC